jgi:hypothetical protein
MKSRGRPFEKGNKLGCGRPKGSRNKKSDPGKELLKEYEPHLTRKLIALGLEGDPRALKICMDRLVPAPRDASVHIALPKVMKSNGDLVNAAEKITRGVGKGILSPSDGEKIMNVIEGQSRVIENADLEKRVEQLESHGSTDKEEPPK